MTATGGAWRRLKSLWLTAWPFWMLLMFASLAAVRLLPGGYMRAMAAAPILLIVPGSLTLGAVFSQRRRPRGVAFVCYAAVLSAVWASFASLALYVFHLLITAESTYSCLLIILVVLAIVAEAQLLLGQGRGRRVVRKSGALDPDLPDAETDDEISPAKGAAFHAVIAFAAGVSVLAGGVYVYNHLSHPARPGYTWIAWTGPRINGDISIGTVGKQLTFKVVHRQSDTITFRLSAAWMGSPSRSLARPITLSIGPNQTFRGALHIPPLPDGCTYRIVVELTAARQGDSLRQKPQNWSINANVRDPSKSTKTCR